MRYDRSEFDVDYYFPRYRQYGEEEDLIDDCNLLAFEKFKIEICPVNNNYVEIKIPVENFRYEDGNLILKTNINRMEKNEFRALFDNVYLEDIKEDSK